MTAKYPIDKDKLKASMAKLNNIYTDIAQTTTEVSRWRCPYKNAKDRCTAKFGCRNQSFADGSDQLALCIGSDKLNYRDAWGV